MRTDFDKCHNLSKRNVKLILKILSDLEPLRGSSNKRTLYSTRSCVNWTFFSTRGPLKRSFHSRFNLAHSYQKKPKLHTNSLNKELLFYRANNVVVCFTDNKFKTWSIRLMRVYLLQQEHLT
jgi:hypothetical protein